MVVGGSGGCTDVPVMMSQIRLAHEIRLYTNNSAKQRTVLINSACDVLIQLSGIYCGVFANFQVKAEK